MTEPDRRLEYHQLHRLGRRGWWRPLVGLLLIVVLFFLVPAVIVQPLFVVGYALTGADVAATASRLVDTDHVTPGGLAYLNVALAAAIPSAMLVTWAVHGLRPRWLASVLPRIRWRWLAVSLGLAAIALLATLIVSAVLPQQAGDGSDVGGGLNPWTSTLRDFVLVVLLLTPLQAAGEEYVFRGYLTQAFGGVFGAFGPAVQRVAAVVIPAVLFALAHGGQDPPVFVDRFAFGLVAGILVITTGGLEAGIAMHVLNNFLAFGLALAYSDMTSALNPTGGSWWAILSTLTQSLVYLGLATYAARRLGVRNRMAAEVVAPVLEGLPPRV